MNHQPQLARQFRSVLFPSGDEGQTGKEPDFFHDVNLDQIVDAIVADDDASCRHYFYAPLHDAGAIRYRHEIMRDLECDALLDSVNRFLAQIARMRRCLELADSLRTTLQCQRWFLDAVSIYCDAVPSLVEALSATHVASRGLRAFREYLEEYARSSRFSELADDARQLTVALRDVSYVVSVRHDIVSVRRREGEPDYGTELTATFERFTGREARDSRISFPDHPEMNDVEERILKRVARLYAESFASVADFAQRHRGYVDGAVERFAREIRFYVRYLGYIGKLRAAGLEFCYPDVAEDDKRTYQEGGFDMALAARLVGGDGSIVQNDFALAPPERVIVVTGPNQGGKTTFARMFAQMQWLGVLGCPVPGAKARVLLFDRLFTHFEREEDVTAVRGKLEDDLIRLRNIFTAATSHSILVMNEIFTSTTLEDATLLGKAVMREVVDRNPVCVWVTFVNELASYGPEVVSMVATVCADDPTIRTFKVVRQPASGRAYALSIAAKYGLTHESIEERVRE